MLDFPEALTVPKNYTAPFELIGTHDQLMLPAQILEPKTL